MYGYTKEEIEVIKAVKVIYKFCMMNGCGPCRFVDDWDECIMRNPEKWILPDAWKGIE